MSMAKHLQEKLDEVYWDNYGEGKLGTAKAVGAAFLSGAIDGAVIVYPFLLISCVMATKELKKLKSE